MRQIITDLEDATQTLPGRLGPHTELYSLEGWDSLGMVAFINLIGERLGVELSVDDLNECGTVEELHTLVQQKIKPT